MNKTLQASNAPPELLMEIIKTQTEIAKQGLDLGGVMNFVADKLQMLTGAGGVMVELAEGDEMVYRAVSGMASGQLGLRLAKKGSLSGLCVAQRQVICCDDSETDDRVDREACRKVGLRSMVVAPLVHCDTVVGALKIASSHPGYFTGMHVRILELTSEVIASAMYHASRYETDALYHQATHDFLTDLANRALFYDRLRQSLSLAKRQNNRIGVLMLDMDRLKPINDNLGHRAGDAAIKEMARRIRLASRECDTVARLGGDEFGIIMNDVQSMDNVLKHVDRLAQEIRQMFMFESTSIILDASIGVAIYPEDGVEMDDLIEHADQDMYVHKRSR